MKESVLRNNDAETKGVDEVEERDVNPFEYLL